MPDPYNKRKFGFIDWVMVILAVILLYFLYIILGGDFNVLQRLRTNIGGDSPISQVINGLSGLGQGIQDSFRDLIR